MATVWSIIAYWILPVPLTLFFLLSLPLPRNLRQGIILFTQRVFDLPLVGAFKLLHVMLWLTAVAFLGSVRHAQQIHQAQAEMMMTNPKMEVSLLSKRWRAERNLWMTAFAFSAWVFLAAFYREAVRRMHLEGRLAEMERSELTATETREREHSVGRGEVTSKAAAAAAAGRERERERTPASVTASPNKTAAAGGLAAAPASVPADVAGGSAARGGIQMQEFKKDM